MQADLAIRAAAPAGRYPAAVVAARTARRAARSGALWGYVFGLTVASSAWGYASAYKTPAQRARLAALFGSNTGLAAINGQAHAIQTVAGYTVWKSFMFLIIVGAVWGLLTGTKLLRGEEDAGRWELLLAGQTTGRRAAAQALAGLGAGLAALWLVTALITVVIGQFARVGIAAAASLFFAAALVTPAAVFLATGALAGQLAATRRQAAGYAGAALGACYALRMAADSDPHLHWLGWTTPLGWAEELQPLTSPRPLVLLPLGGLVAVLCALTVYLAGSRDLGASVLPDRSRAQGHTRLLTGPTGLAVRLARPSAVAVRGGGRRLCPAAGLHRETGRQRPDRLLQRGAGDLAPGGLRRERECLSRIQLPDDRLAGGVHRRRAGHRSPGRGGRRPPRPVAGQAGVPGLVAGRPPGPGRGDPGRQRAAGRVVRLARRRRRRRQREHRQPARRRARRGAPALCVLGIGVLAMGVWPRATAPVTYAVLCWALLIQLAGGFFSSSHWLLDTSVFHHMAAAPG